jgi:hypothetical protein
MAGQRIDTVARAIYEDLREPRDRDTWEQVPGTVRTFYRKVARAAVRALAPLAPATPGARPRRDPPTEESA